MRSATFTAGSTCSTTRWRGSHADIDSRAAGAEHHRLPRRPDRPRPDLGAGRRARCEPIGGPESGRFSWPATTKRCCCGCCAAKASSCATGCGSAAPSAPEAMASIPRRSRAMRSGPGGRHASWAKIPEQHRAFLQSFVDTFRIGSYLFVHAGVRPGVPLAEQTQADLRWIREPVPEQRRRPWLHRRPRPHHRRRSRGPGQPDRPRHRGLPLRRADRDGPRGRRPVVSPDRHARQPSSRRRTRRRGWNAVRTWASGRPAELHSNVRSVAVIKSDSESGLAPAARLGLAIAAGALLLAGCADKRGGPIPYDVGTFGAPDAPMLATLESRLPNRADGHGSASRSSKCRTCRAIMKSI